MLSTSLQRSLPTWVKNIDPNTVCSTEEEQMGFAVGLLRKQIEEMSGGPFAAAIFGPNGELVAIGVNQVVAWNDSTAHAEINAFRLGQDALGRFSFNEASSNGDGYTLATTGQMCAMCFGATPWAGVSKVLVAARADDAEKMGFDEGPIHPKWKEELARRGISVVEDLRRDDVLALYSEYVKKGGAIYVGKVPRAHSDNDLNHSSAPQIPMNREAEAYVASLNEAAGYLQSRITTIPETFIILGSGLGNLASQISDPLTIPYSEIPNMPVTRASGHAGNLIVGNLGETPVMALQGRVHHHDGVSSREVCFASRLMALLGAKQMIVTNAAGGLNSKFQIGDLMVLNNHVSLFVPGDPALGLDGTELFPNRHYAQTDPYDDKLGKLFKNSAEAHGMSCHEGVYAFVTGPRFESRADVRILQALQVVDAVGMSTVPEVLAIKHMRGDEMRILGVSVITNLGAGINDTVPNDDEVKSTGASIGPRLSAVMTEFLQSLSDSVTSNP